MKSYRVDCFTGASFVVQAHDSGRAAKIVWLTYRQAARRVTQVAP